MKMTHELIREWKQDGFRLELYDTYKVDSLGKSRLAYRFYFTTADRPYPANAYSRFRGEEHLIFEGEDFCCSPLHATDSDECIGSLLTFLSLRPGDTDREYFDGYSEEQLEFANHYGEELALLADELENGIECCASVCGDSALLDFRCDTDTDELRTDDEGETAIFTLRCSPSMARRAYDYCHGNNGPEPYSDGYEAMEVFQEAKDQEVVSCSVPWPESECRRLGGCYLCGGFHEGRDDE